jgi:hypothetical protein
MDERIACYPPAKFATFTTDMWTEPFWKSVAARELRLPRCNNCGDYRMPPTPFCPACHAQDIDWVCYSGRAVLYSYTVVERNIVPGMEESLPYVPAVVEFPDAQGIRLITNIVGCAIGDLKVGATLQLEWIEPRQGLVLPAFTPAQNDYIQNKVKG